MSHLQTFFLIKFGLNFHALFFKRFIFILSLIYKSDLRISCFRNGREITRIKPFSSQKYNFIMWPNYQLQIKVPRVSLWSVFLNYDTSLFNVTAYKSFVDVNSTLLFYFQKISLTLFLEKSPNISWYNITIFLEL